MIKHLKKILVVDDDPLIRQMLSEILKEKNFAVELAKNGAEALEKYNNNNNIDLIVSDITMPVMDGLQLVQELRKARKNVPVIILTVNDNVATAVNALNIGANDYLIKDKNINKTILPSIEKIIEKQKLDRENKQLRSKLALTNSELNNLKNKRADIIDKLTDTGTALSSEKNLQKLLEAVVTKSRSITHADGATLYLLKGHMLHFKIVQNESMNMHMGGTSKNKVTIPPIPLHESNASAYSAIKKEIINVPDVYMSQSFDFSGPIRFDTEKGYLTKSMLHIPMINRDNDVIGVLQLINALDPGTSKIIEFSKYYENIAHSLASQAAVAITNTVLYDEIKELFESMVEVMATALDEKSPVTRGHIANVALLTMAMAEEINSDQNGYFKDVKFSEDELRELRISALLHDVGKITTPEAIVEKKTKLETIFDRMGMIKFRVKYIRSELIIETLRKINLALKNGEPKKTKEEFERQLEEQLKEIDSDLTLIEEVNNPEEFMDDTKFERLKQVAGKKLMIDGKEHFLLTEEEFHYLSVRKGSITPKELEIMRNHASVTIKMLNKIPFTKKLKNVPVYAGGHHERLDGTGYPTGLKAAEIPLQTRIIAFTDLFEALVAKDRPYKKPIPLEKALQILEFEVKNNHIDANLLDLFKENKIYEKI